MTGGLDTHPTWMEMDYPAVSWNVGLLRRRLLPDTKIIASVKANAYGHGIAEVVRNLVVANVDTIATGSFADALAVKRQGLDVEIVMLAGTSAQGMGELIAAGVMPTVHTVALAEAASAAARGPVRVYVKIDCGHGRLGFPVTSALETVLEISRLPNLSIEGLYTHLPFSNSGQRDWVEGGIAKFDHLVRGLEHRGLSIPVRQARASAAIVSGIGDTCNAVCPGGLLYGKSPIDEAFPDESDFRPVLAAVRSRIIQVTRDLSVSRYRDRVRGPTGVVPFGRCDGHRPAKPGASAYALVRGRRAPVLAVSLEHAVLDLSAVPDANEGDLVTLLGADGDQRIRLDDVAAWQGIAGSDVLMALNDRMPRVPITAAAS